MFALLVCTSYHQSASYFPSACKTLLLLYFMVGHEYNMWKLYKITKGEMPVALGFKIAKQEAKYVQLLHSLIRHRPELYFAKSIYLSRQLFYQTWQLKQFYGWCADNEILDNRLIIQLIVWGILRNYIWIFRCIV